MGVQIRQLHKFIQSFLLTIYRYENANLVEIKLAVFDTPSSPGFPLVFLAESSDQCDRICLRRAVTSDGSEYGGVEILMPG